MFTQYKDVFNPNVTTFQSNYAEVLHFSAFHYYYYYYYYYYYCNTQTKNASHFAAWSSCLLAHEMYRKAQLTGTEGVRGEREGEKGAEVGRGMEEWMSRTQEVIGTLKSGVCVGREGGIHVRM